MSDRPWQAALDAKVDILRFWRSSYAQPFAKGIASGRSGAVETTFDPEAFIGVGHALVYQGEPIYVAPDMMSLVVAAAATFEIEPIRLPDMLVQKGVLYLPRPVVFGEIAFRVIAWGVIGTTPELVLAPNEGDDAVHVFLYHAAHDRDGLVRGDRRMAAPFTFLPEAEQIWWVGRRYEEADPVVLQAMAFVQVLWRLMAQTIAVKDRRPVDRATGKRAARADVHENGVLVVTLRRSEHKPTEAETDVEWSHRWLVGGHWRNQWYQSESVHRQIWISPYVKGPEDKPLVIREARAWAFVR